MQTHSLKLDWDSVFHSAVQTMKHFHSVVQTLLIVLRFALGGVSFVFFMCLAVLFSRELDLCVLNIKLFLYRLYMTLLFLIVLRIF